MLQAHCHQFLGLYILPTSPTRFVRWYGRMASIVRERGEKGAEDERSGWARTVGSSQLHKCGTMKTEEAAVEHAQATKCLLLKE